MVFGMILFQAFAQKLVEAQLLETRSKDELNLFFGFIGVSAEYGINAYKIRYETLDTDGRIDTASGLLVLPILDTPAPIIAYQHGTSSNKEDVPSRLPQEAFLTYYFAGRGFITTAADYLGLGDSKRLIHPYIHADTEASAGIDLVRAAKEFMTSEGVDFNEQLFITGYSQGGHAGMAMHKEIETNLTEEFTVTAASHMSGPYALSNNVLNTSMDDAAYDFPSYVVWMFVAYQSVYGNLYEDLSEVFVDNFVPVIEQFSKGEVTRGALNTILVDQLTELHGASFPNRLFKPSFLEALQNDPDHPARVALRDNDLFDWVPTAPTQLLYCKADEQVSYLNAVTTDSIMNANGAASVTSIDIDSEGSHGDCVIPATDNTVEFFLQFVEGFTAVKSINPILDFQISPNPAQEVIQVQLSLETNTEITLQLINLQGQVLTQNILQNTGSISLPTAAYDNGMYLIRLQSADGFWVKKVMISK